jgi:alkylation response protein AidB-like acyl-CoA dehydrogenase
MTQTDPAHLIDVARTVTAEQIAPRAWQIDRERRFPKENIATLGDAGLLGLTVPRRFGGHGYGAEQYAVPVDVVYEVARGCASTAQALMVHFTACIQIDGMATEEQRRLFLAPAAEGTAFFGSWASEVNRTPTRWDTVAEPAGDGYLVTGRKFFATNSGGASHFLLWTVVPEGSIAQDLLLCVVPIDAPGVTVVDDWDAIGQRGTTSGSVLFDRCVVPRDGVLGEPGSYYAHPLYGPMFQLGFAAIYAGIGRGAFDHARRIVQARRHPRLESYAHDPIVQLHVAEMDVALSGAELLVREAARRLEAGAARPDDEAARVAAAVAFDREKAATTRPALDTCNLAPQVTGTAGMTGETPLDLYWRNARTLTLHDPVDRRLEVIGRHLLGVEDPRPGLL